MVTWGTNTTAVFGAAATPSTPPAASAAPAGFPPPPLGAAPVAAPAASLFGGPPAPAAGLFGAPAPAAGGLFGGTAAAPAPAGGLFGATPAPAPAAGGLFGAPAAPAAGGLFGAPAPAPGFGAPPPPQTNPQQAALHAHHSASQRQEAARLEEALGRLRARYAPAGAAGAPSAECAFAAVLYDPLPPEHRARGPLGVPKPPHVGAGAWNEALARNPGPTELVPVALVGAPALHARLVAQQEKANALAAHAASLRDTVRFLEKAALRDSRDGIRRAGEEQEALRRRLLGVMRKVEIVRCMGQATQRAEADAGRRLGEIAGRVHGVGRSLAALEERGRQQAREWRRGGAARDSGRPGAGAEVLHAEDRAALFHVMNEQRLGMERLGGIVRRDARDVGIVKDELRGASSHAAPALPPSGAVVFGGR